MLHLMKLELKKTHFQNYLLIFVITVIMSMFFMAVSVHDSSGKTHTFAETFRVIEMVSAFVFIILFSVLNASVIISEYNSKTIWIMFAYPINRQKLILAKLLLITVLVAVMIIAGYAVCGSFLVYADKMYNWVEGDFQISTFRYMISRTFTTAIMFCILGLWTFVAGMWKKSVPVTIVSSVLFIYIRQIAVASTETYEETVWMILAAGILALAGIWYIFKKKIMEA